MPSPLRELHALLQQRWQTLPQPAQTPQQVAGRGGVACGATWGVMERCNFACTSCYLSELGNQTKPLPFEEVAAQLRTLRDHLGAHGKVQITAGEVTLLPVDELGRVIRYALGLGLDPMLMTNGERLRHEEDYFVRLVRDHGLRKVSLHIDTTQKGRRWSPRAKDSPMPMGLQEEDLEPLRDEFAALVRRVEQRTRTRLHMAHTVTVTPRTLDGVAHLASWALRQRTFRLVSFLPVAEVGRTEDRRDDGLNLDTLWRKVEVGAGRPLNRDAMHFGHRECNITVPLLVLGRDGRGVVEVVRTDRRWDRRVFARILEYLPIRLDLDRGIATNAWRSLGVALRRPGFGIETAAWIVMRMVGVLVTALRMLMRGELPRPRLLLLVVHKFMNGDELTTPLGRERLDACVFKVPLADGRLISMCEMNATDLRHQLNATRLGTCGPNGCTES